MSRLLHLRTPQLDAITRHARETAPQECCGLLAGEGISVQQAYPVRNVSPTPETHYEMEPAGLLRSLQQIDRDGWVPVAVYHSHPASHPIPSPEDVRQARTHTPTLLHLIISLQHNTTRLQAWEINDEGVTPVELLFNNESSRTPGPVTRAQRVAFALAAVLAVFILVAVSVILLPPAPTITPAP